VGKSKIRAGTRVGVGQVAPRNPILSGPNESPGGGYRKGEAPDCSGTRVTEIEYENINLGKRNITSSCLREKPKERIRFN